MVQYNMISEADKFLYYVIVIKKIKSREKDPLKLGIVKNYKNRQRNIHSFQKRQNQILASLMNGKINKKTINQMRS